MKNKKMIKIEVSDSRASKPGHVKMSMEISGRTKSEIIRGLEF